MKIILGISAFYHDSAATIRVNGKIIAAAQEERFIKKKIPSRQLVIKHIKLNLNSFL